MSASDVCYNRTTWGIVSSCLTTVFSCTWVAIHPNIPGPDETSIEIAFSRVGLMLMALIAPELVIVWAMKQWFGARRIAKDHSEHVWTKTHGFFTLMGGFMRVRGKMDVPVEVILPNAISSHLKFDEFPPITEAHIQDRSKRDAISKGLVLAQTMWFILQCLGRAIERLPITELETVTLAFTVLNLATYWFWWNKPADVRYPYTIREQPNEHGDELLEGGNEGGNGAEDRHEGRNGFVRIIVRFNSKVRVVFLSVRGLARMSQPLQRVFTIPYDILAIAFFEPFLRPVPAEGDLQVPTFYAGDLEDREDNLVAWISAPIASVFGVIHCFAWSLEFPSHTQQLIWRVSAVTIALAPLLAMGAFQFRKSRSLRCFGLVNAVFFLLVGATPILYAIARIALLVLAFKSLRSLPPGAFETVCWTTYIPHL
ncbi:hypothetical protein JAAARDRAFT_195720 [Jaapia argillacea MUCL 33604]|uniref:Uncharacterized protein n=1 Tax=Jaapia argillacea MUCL 33604 TaxID=933084 RepID=A0A067PK84_9AGAM|nr:hypothetical protein JAAARDRAFT_195720 [Jaapia argillacea MUCL 33604]